MSAFNDIAKRNPKKAIAVIQKFGYTITDNSDLGRSLSELVSNEGEPALRAVMEIHPDKDIILELFGDSKNTEKSDGCGCSCGGKCGGHKNMDGYMNASGNSSEDQKNQKDSTNILAHQTNAILIVASLFIATALIIKNK